MHRGLGARNVISSQLEMLLNKISRALCHTHFSFREWVKVHNSYKKKLKINNQIGMVVWGMRGKIRPGLLQPPLHNRCLKSLSVDLPSLSINTHAKKLRNARRLLGARVGLSLATLVTRLLNRAQVKSKSCTLIIKGILVCDQTDLKQ